MSRYMVAVFIGIAVFTAVPILLYGQYTAPAPSVGKKDVPKNVAMNTAPFSAPEVMPQPVEIIKVQQGNPEHMEPGFYASIKPSAFDTVFIYEGGTEQFEVIEVHPGKEIIHSPDSAQVAEDVSFRMNHFDESGMPVTSVKKSHLNSAVIRSGAIPAQGFGSKRYRFAVKPSRFNLDKSSMISASVHMTANANIGTILCSVTGIDYEKGIFFVEASNEVPKGENITWIIVNTPE